MENYRKYFIFIAIGLVIILFSLIPLIIIFDSKSTNSETNYGEDKNIIFPTNTKTINYIQVVKPPNKMEYKEGEIFDKEGMIIKAFYDNNYQAYVDNYLIDKIRPLTIYDSKVTVSYNEKETNFYIKITNDEEIIINPNPSKEQYTFEPVEGITRYEIENADLTNWKINGQDNKMKIIERIDASGGSFLSGIDENVSYEGKLIFNIDLKFNAELTMNVSYSQNEEYKFYPVDLLTMYTFLIDENRNIEIDGYRMLDSRQDITQWQKIKYKPYTLPKGRHSLSIKSRANSALGSPNIDYIDFKVKRIEEMPNNPDEVPLNDFHTSLQYKYINDEFPENIINYANGVENLSRPKGNILNFSENLKENSYSYVIQISSSNNFDSPDTKIIYNLKEKKYALKNLKLGQHIFYRGAISVDRLASGIIYELNVNTLPPRNLDIPGVDNARDIGGFKTTLVENGIIKQGLYYRSAKLDDIEESGKRILTEDLGIKVEIDLRDEIYNNGPYVDGIAYYPIPILSGSESTRFENFNEQYIKVFDLISNADQNPVIIHCTAGADRTGIMTFALMTLLGCEYNDIARDYLFTNFSMEGLRNINSEFTTWWSKLDLYEGDTKAEKCKSWLRSKGIEEFKLEHIRSIFINGYKS